MPPPQYGQVFRAPEESDRLTKTPAFTTSQDALRDLAGTDAAASLTSVPPRVQTSWEVRPLPVTPYGALQ
jgi:hypothetical protein